MFYNSDLEEKGLTQFKGKVHVQHWFLVMYAYFIPNMLNKYSIKLTCESFFTIGEHVFENNYEKLLNVFFKCILMFYKKLPDGNFW